MFKIDSTYGSDKNGLIWGYQFTPSQPGKLITIEAATKFLTLPETVSSEEFIWLHFSLSNSASELWLRRNLNLPEPFYETLHNEVGSTRLEQDADSLMAVIYDVLFDFAFDASAVATASLFIQPRLLVSIRLRPLRSIDRLRAAVRTGQVFDSTIELLTHLLQEQADVLVDILRQSTLQVDRIEDKLMANQVTVSRIELGSLRRVLVRLQRLLAPEPAALFRLLNRPPEWIVEADIQNLQQAAEELSAAVGDAAALIERVKLLQEELTAQVNEQTNRTLFVLTVVTVLALPINLVASLFGMNVGGMPLTNNNYGFFLIVSVLSIITLLLAYLAFSKQRN